LVQGERTFPGQNRRLPKAATRSKRTNRSTGNFESQVGKNKQKSLLCL